VFELDDVTDWVVVVIVATVFYGLVFAVAHWLLNIGFGPK
jgi:hypothetical protein